MKLKIIAEAFLLGLAALTAYAFYASGLSGLVDFYTTENMWNHQVSLDLVIALSVASYFIYKDAKSRGISPLPYLALTLTGSFGPLVYLLMRRRSAQ